MQIIKINKKNKRMKRNFLRSIVANITEPVKYNVNETEIVVTGYNPTAFSRKRYRRSNQKII